MANLLNFHYGLVKDLPAQVTDGNLYVTTDSQGLYVDLDGSRIHVSDFIQVASKTALDALGSYDTHVFYYVEGSNALLKYVGATTNDAGEIQHNWKQLNSTAELSSALETLAGRVTKNEGDISSLNTSVAAVDAKVDALNATDIETTQKITVTTAVGNYAKGAEIDVNTDLQTLILNMLCKDSNPSTTWPKISSVSLTGAGAKEVGTTFEPAYTINTDAGKYVANGVTQSSGVTFKNYLGTEVNRPDSLDEQSANTKTGTFTSFVVTDDVDYYVKGSASHTAGNMPKTYLGKDYPSGQITAKDLSAVNSTHVTGYRPIFYGMTTSTADLNSAAVRALTKIDAAPAAQKVTFKAANLAGVKRFIVAIPASSSLTVKKAIITSSQNADATSDYVKQTATVAVQGAAGYTTTKPYNIWIYEPASIASVEVHEVTIG